MRPAVAASGMEGFIEQPHSARNSISIYFAGNVWLKNRRQVGTKGILRDWGGKGDSSNEFLPCMKITSVAKCRVKGTEMYENRSCFQCKNDKSSSFCRNLLSFEKISKGWSCERKHKYSGTLELLSSRTLHIILFQRNQAAWRKRNNIELY